MDNIPSPPPPPPPPPPTTTSPVKHPDPDPRIRPDTTPKLLPPPFTNGVLKRLKPRHHHHHPVVVIYRECLKNHAASMGGHAVDGCGEFMPAPTSTPTDPTSLKCAACGCHRNFHRRDPDGSSFPNNNPPVQHLIEYQPHHRHHPLPPPPLAGLNENSTSPADSPSPPPISSSYYPSAPHMLLALSSGLSAPPAGDNNVNNSNTQYVPISGGLNLTGSNSAGKKRFRTKFSQDQKEKMHELAERVGWKMQKKDEDLIIGFCNEIGVDRGVFKVWMHNNKMTFGGKKDSDIHLAGNGSNDGGTGGGGGGGLGVDFFLNRNNNHHHHHQPPAQNNDSVSSGGGNATGGDGGDGGNGSSSSY
ncbi:hypothetical protein SSX86_014552 [Deinandra increscens subsp. villosa]|uniref:ZF-HD dimerization-type domain-containing protein n=1 Tax=Deinandra increscens subsp. villosa TaxID=3103831 RepID=A0AAP0D249_9ASTR